MLGAGEAIGLTVLLVLVAGVTAGLWLNILMWIPMLLIGWFVHDEDTAFAVVSLLSMAVATVAAFFVGWKTLDLLWVAAAIAGILVGITSYARPNPAHAGDLG